MMILFMYKDSLSLNLKVSDPGIFSDKNMALYDVTLGKWEDFWKVLETSFLNPIIHPPNPSNPRNPAH